MGTAWVSLCLWKVLFFSFVHCSSVTCYIAPRVFLLMLPSHCQWWWWQRRGVSKWLYGCLPVGQSQPTASTLFYCDVFFKMLFLLSFNQLVFCSHEVLSFFQSLIITVFPHQKVKLHSACHFPFTT